MANSAYLVNDLGGLFFVEVLHAMRVLFFRHEKSFQDLCHQPGRDSRVLLNVSAVPLG
jgi:hypothetical protein